MRILIILLLLSNLTFGQNIFSFSIDLPYPDRVETDSVIEYIAKSDSIWKQYKKDGFQRVDLEYKNNVNLQLIYDSLGNGKQFIEFFSDTIGVELSYSKRTNAYTLKKYDWYYGNNFNLEYWYPNDSIFEYWRYDDLENLKEVLKIKKGENIKTVEITDITNFRESTIKYTYRKFDGKWIIDDTIEVIEE